MQTVTLADAQNNPSVFNQIHRALDRDGVVCIPCNGSYRIIADLMSVEAVTRLFQSKRRVKKAPSLVFVQDRAMLNRVVREVPEALNPLVDLWPGPLTILFDVSDEVPKKVRKQLGKGKIGVRIPNSPLMQQLVAALGRPVLVSSANKEKKHGETSPAQVRQSFMGRIDLFVEAGDLTKEDSSTVVDVLDGKLQVTRPGAFEEALLQEFFSP